MKTNKGQNIIEYILMAVAVILVLLLVLNPTTGSFKNGVENILYNTTINSGLSAISIPAK